MKYLDLKRAKRVYVEIVPPFRVLKESISKVQVIFRQKVLLYEDISEWSHIGMVTPQQAEI